MKLLTFLISFVIIMILVTGCMRTDPEPCTPNWQCSDWTACSLSGIQTRDCSDLNSCGSQNEIPAEIQNCAAQTNAQVVSPVAGHAFSVRGQFYDTDPHVPILTQDDLQKAKQNAIGEVNVCTGCDNIKLVDDFNYICVDLKNEGTQGFTIAEASATGSSSRDQVLNFYWRTLDTIQREENCQRYAGILLSANSPVTNLQTDLEISQSDEGKEFRGYNSVAEKFNQEIYQCPEGNIIGTDGLCHQTCSPSNLYCPSDSTCLSETCFKCLPGFSLTSDLGCILQNTPQSSNPNQAYVLPVTSLSPSPTVHQGSQPQSYHYHEYIPGDTVGTEDTKGTKLAIISYDSSTDEYVIFAGVGCCLREDRSELESKYLYKYSHSSNPGSCPC